MKLETQNLNKTFPSLGQTQEIEILININLTLEVGEKMAIVGSSGSGKSTLLSLLSLLDTPTSGQILFDDKNILQMSEKELIRFRAENFGIVFQNIYLIPSLTALENIMLPLEILGIESPLEKANEAIKKVKMDDRASHYPHQMSGGECQRIAIARAFITHPKILIVDEPTGNLDQDNSENIAQLLFQMSDIEKTSVILSTHDANLAKRCDTMKKIIDKQLQ